ncbi:hypothetical protein [Thiohalomonas denitrificans]|uniref:Transmembrane protein n=1 Tax=Thiohalomonas denitrificans TaxID=415747 RepID=A0A1G5QIM3_9GAMM|nr:hypothetical protein [Thiohalomonas denitrificans]SCZ61654.1 hypothetical protein SAMN03097708_02174 [Thiohalomonas denitrificans]
MARMNAAALSLEQAPPISVPVRFFLTAPVFGAAAALILLVSGGEVLSSRWAPLTLAVTHLLTLGFLAMVMIGAVQQLLPVLVGSPVPRAKWVSRILHPLLTLGVVSLVAGFAGGGTVLMHGATVLLGSGFLVFLAVTAFSLLRARSGHFTVAAMALSTFALAITVALGLYLALGYAGAVPMARQYTNLHLGWGLIGWVVLLLAGVAYQVVPMFQITPDYPRPLMRLLAPGLFVLLGVWSLGRAMSMVPDAIATIAAGLIAAGVLLFALATVCLQVRRKRRLPDVTLDFWRMAMASLVVVVLVWAVGQALDNIPELLLGVLFIAGFAMSAVNGMLYKIVPFLVWLHLNNQRQSAGLSLVGVPNMRKIIPEPAMRWQFRVQAGALVLLAAAAVWPVLTSPAGLLLFISMVWLGWNLLGAMRLYRRTLRA